MITEEVAVMNVGSEISCLLIDRLRGERRASDECANGGSGFIMMGAGGGAWLGGREFGGGGLREEKPDAAVEGRPGWFACDGKLEPGWIDEFEAELGGK